MTSEIKSISLKDVTPYPYFKDDGRKLFKEICSGFNKGQRVEVSFADIDSVTRIFVKAAFVDLLLFYSFDQIKKHLNFLNSTSHINERISEVFIEALEKEKI